MNLALITASLERGGTERVISILANAWASQGKDVTVLVLNRNDRAAYPLDRLVKVRNLGLDPSRSQHALQALARTVKKVRVLRAAIREVAPQVAVSFIDFPNILTLLASRGLGVPVIVSERVDPTLYSIGAVWSTLRKATYPQAQALVCQTQTTLTYFQRRTRANGVVIPNPVMAVHDPGKHRSKNQKQHKVLLAMGRLVWQKGFDLLIEAFSRIAARHPDWVLQIAGGGPLQEQLRNQAERNGLKARVRLLGSVKEPSALLAAADIFVLSSRFEGFPNALCEAMACGLPVVSFDCPAGPREIIRDGVDGTLVPAEDVAALSASLDRLMSSPEERARLASNAPEVSSRFSLESVLGLWDRLFETVLRGNDREQPASVSHA